jgi:hypothetical protein
MLKGGVVRTLSKGAASVLLVVLGCGGGGFGDEPPPVQGSVLGKGRSLASLNDPANPRPAETESILSTGLRVVFEDRFDETGSGNVGNIFLQDFVSPPGPYQGILAFRSSYTPPSFRVSEGDVVDATGQYVEFQPNVDFLKKERPGWTTPEINANLRLRFDAPYIPLVPVEVSVTDFVVYETGRPWLSMLVTAKNIKLINNVTIDSAGRASAGMDVGSGVPLNLVPTLTNELFDLAAYAEEIKAERQINSLEGIEFESVTGIVTLFDRFHIAPRSADDLKLK